MFWYKILKSNFKYKDDFSTEVCLNMDRVGLYMCSTDIHGLTYVYINPWNNLCNHS